MGKNMIEFKEIQDSSDAKSISDLALYSAGYEKCETGYGYGPIYRTYQLIHFVLDGKGKLDINGKIFNLKKGDAFIIPEGVISYYEADKKEPWTYTWISFLGINSLMYAYQLMSKSKDIYIFRNLNIEKYKNYILSIISLKKNPEVNYFKINSILFNIIGNLFEDLEIEKISSQKISTIDEIKFFFDLNYPKKIRIADIAQNFGIHPNYLSRKFQEKFNSSPKSYIQNLKLKKACKLLRSTDIPISIISESLGFEDQFVFSRIFKKNFLISPLAYRKSNNIKF